MTDKPTVTAVDATWTLIHNDLINGNVKEALERFTTFVGLFDRTEEAMTTEKRIPPAPNDGRSYKELLDALRATVIGLYYLLPADGESYERMSVGISALNQLENYHGKN